MSFYTFLPTLLNMSLTAGVAILFVMLLRLLLRRAPKVISYALWAVVLFRLLCPVAVNSALSLFNLFDPTVPAAVETQAEATGFVEPAVPPTLAALVPQNPAAEAPPVTAEPAPEATPAIPAYAWVWMAGVLAMAAYSALTYIRLKHNLLASVLLRDNIYLSDGIASPFVMGLVRPKIYLPSSLEEREQDYIILHEQHHIKRLDHIIKAVAFAALCIHWFNPLVWLAFVLAGKDMEMSCDEAVIKKLGEGVRADYSASLLSLATGRRVIAGAPLAFGEGDTKGRIRNLANWRKPAFWVVLVSILACVALAVGLLTNPAEDTVPEGDAYHLRIGTEGVTEIKMTTPNISSGITRADGSPFDVGEEVYLEIPYGIDGLRGVTITAMNGDGEILYVLSVPESIPDEEIVNAAAGDGWLLTPTNRRLNMLDYKNAIPVLAETGELTAIYCPSSQEASDNIIQIGAAGSPDLARYLEERNWKECAPPRNSLPSPGSVEFVITDDYRITVHQRKDGSLRQYAEVEFRGERRYYRIKSGDYPDAVALVYAKNPAAENVSAVEEWFDFLDSPGDMPWGNRLEREIPAFPDLTFRYTPEEITAGNKSAEKTILTGMPIWNAYFADISGDGMPEICATATFGSGIIDSRIIVHDYMAGETYTLEDRGKYDYRLTLRDGRLIVEQYLYPTEGAPIAAGTLTLQDNGLGGRELRMDLQPEEPDREKTEIIRDIDLDHDGSPESVHLTEKGDGQMYTLNVVKADGPVLWSKELYTPHMGWGTILLYERDGRDYLISYDPRMYQGDGDYDCTLFSLEGGRENIIGAWSVDFDRVDFTKPMPISGEMQAFKDAVDPLLKESTLLVTTEQGELVIGPRPAAELPQICPVYFDMEEMYAAINTPESIAAARYAEMEALFKMTDPRYESDERVTGDWNGDGVRDSVGFSGERQNAFTIELSGQEPISIRPADTLYGNAGGYSADTRWGWEYYFDTGDLDGDGSPELVFAIDTGAQGGDGGYCVLICPTDGRGFEAFHQIEKGPDYRLYWEGETDTVRIECEALGYEERITEESLILPYLGTPEEAADRIAWMEEHPDSPKSVSDPVGAFALTEDGRIVTRQYMTVPGGAHSERYGYMLTQYAYHEDGSLFGTSSWFVHQPLD